MGALQNVARAGRNWEPTWRYVFNLAPTVKYKVGGRTPSGVAGQVLDTLNRDGVAVTSAEKLLGPSSLFHELQTAVDTEERKRAGEIEGARQAAMAPQRGAA